MNPSAAYALTFLLDEAEATRGSMPEADAIATLIAEREERYILNRAEADDLFDALSAAKQSRQWNATGPTVTAILRAQADEALRHLRPGGAR